MRNNHLSVRICLLSIRNAPHYAKRRTFAGLLLDRFKDKDSTPGASTGQKRAIQQLLNVFLFLNICHFLSILGLWYLDRRRKSQLAEIENKLREQGLEDECTTEPEIEPELLRGHMAGHGSRKERASESHSLRARDSVNVSPANPFMIGLPKASSSEPRVDEDEGEEAEEEQPLLHEPDSARSSRLLEAQAELDRPVAGEAQTNAEHVRGEIFSVMSICVIAFAWIFFITTAFLRLRAKKDRK